MGELRVCAPTPTWLVGGLVAAAVAGCGSRTFLPVDADPMCPIYSVASIGSGGAFCYPAAAKPTGACSSEALACPFCAYANCAILSELLTPRTYFDCRCVGGPWACTVIGQFGSLCPPKISCLSSDGGLSAVCLASSGESVSWAATAADPFATSRMAFLRTSPRSDAVAVHARRGAHAAIPCCRAVFASEMGQHRTFSGGHRAEGPTSRAEGSADVVKRRVHRAEGSADVVKRRVDRGEGSATRAEGSADIVERRVDRAEGNATRAEGNATRAEGNATRAEGSAARADGAAYVIKGCTKGRESRAPARDSCPLPPHSYTPSRDSCGH
jgi:hypothetical protein